MWLTADPLNHHYYDIFSAHKHLLHLIPLAAEICFQYVAQIPAFHLGTRVFQNS